MGYFNASRLRDLNFLVEILRKKTEFQYVIKDEYDYILQFVEYFQVNVLGMDAKKSG